MGEGRERSQSPWDHGAPPQRTLWCTGEEDIKKTLVPRLLKLKADLRQITFYDGLANDVVMLSNLTGLEQRIKELQPALLVFDPLISFLEADANMNSANAMKQALRNLERLLQTHGTACLLTRHLTKDSKSKAIYRGLSSVALAGTFRSILFVDHDPTVQREQGITRGVMAHSKCSYEAIGSSLTYRIDAQRFEWTGTSELSANQLNSPATEDKLREAVSFLKEFLGTQARPSTEVKEVAMEGHGIAYATLRRACKQLKVEVYQKDRVWVWELPVKRTGLRPLRRAEQQGSDVHV
jgi:DNA repair protein RadA/Sms